MILENSINEISLLDGIEIKEKDTVLGIVFPFYEKGKVVTSSLFQNEFITQNKTITQNESIVQNDSFFLSSWGISFKSSGSMLFSPEKENSFRDAFFATLFKNNFLFKTLSLSKNPVLNKKVLAVSLIHSKKVFFISNDDDIKKLQNNSFLGDGIITDNCDFIPTITVADCVPIYLFDKKTGCRSVVHSGWKGTGIAAVAVKTICDRFNSSPNDILVAIGPHIGSCCYSVDEERALFFKHEFGEACVLENKHLSLLNANIKVLNRAGISNDRITILPECTCCNNLLGSFRREKVLNGYDDFTRMVAFIL